jgi:hypothetical protein
MRGSRISTKEHPWLAACRGREGFNPLNRAKGNAQWPYIDTREREKERERERERRWIDKIA